MSASGGGGDADAELARARKRESLRATVAAEREASVPVYEGRREPPSPVLER